MGAVNLNEVIGKCCDWGAVLHDVANDLVLDIIREPAVCFNRAIEAQWVTGENRHIETDT